MPPLFLPKSTRAKLHLSKQDLLKRSAEDKRQTFSVFCSLSDGNAMTGMPDWVQNAYTQMIRIANKSKKQVFDVVIPNCFIEVFGSLKTKSKLFAIIKEATLSNFTMERTGKDEEDVAVKLSFKISFAARKEIYDWFWEAKKDDFFASFEESQQDLSFQAARDAQTDSDDEDDSDEDDEEEQEDLPLDDDEEEEEDEDDSDDNEGDEVEEASPAAVAESQSARAIRIRKEAEKNAAATPPAARPAFTVTRPATH
jgi:hypothetical protein